MHLEHMSGLAILAREVGFLTASPGAVLLHRLGCMSGSRTSSSALPEKAPRRESTRAETQQLPAVERCWPKTSKLCFILCCLNNCLLKIWKNCSLKGKWRSKICFMFLFLRCRKVLEITCFSSHQKAELHFQF